jgi:hypothetical protein
MWEGSIRVNESFILLFVCLEAEVSLRHFTLPEFNQNSGGLHTMPLTILLRIRAPLHTT